MNIKNKGQRKTKQLSPSHPHEQPDYPLKKDGHPALVDPRAIRSALAIMDQAAVNGGSACHWGGPSGLAEILSSLYGHVYQTTAPWDEKINIVNDIGHAHNAFYALYALYRLIPYQDLNGFRSMTSKLTGHGEGHLFPEGVLLSNGPLGSTIAQSQGLSIGDALLKNNRKTIALVSDGGMMEGEVKEALASIPGLYAKGKMNPYVLIISDNNTKLSGRIEKDAFSMSPTFTSLETLGWEIIKIDGHNLWDLSTLFQNLLAAPVERFTRPIAIVAKTIKGFGVRTTMESPSGGHGFPLKAFDANLVSFLEEIWGTDKVPTFFLNWAKELTTPQTSQNNSSTTAKTPSDKVQAGFGKAAIATRKKGIPVVSVTSDLPGSTGIAPFIKEFPEASFDVGIAESNMVSVAAGLSKVGFVPIVDTFAAFGVTKGSLPLVMAALSQAPLIALYTHTGFQDAADGASHQSLTYASMLGSIPDVDLVAPATAQEAEVLLTFAIERQHQSWIKNEICPSTIFFAGRENYPLSFGNSTAFTTHIEKNWGKPQIVQTGNTNTLIISYGPLVHESLKAASIIEESTSQKPFVINHLFLNHFDIREYVNILDPHAAAIIIFVEDHQKCGGVGNWFFAKLWETLVAKDSKYLQKIQIAHLAVEGQFGQSAYSAGELYSHHGLNAQAIASKALEMLS